MGGRVREGSTRGRLKDRREGGRVKEEGLGGGEGEKERAYRRMCRLPFRNRRVTVLFIRGFHAFPEFDGFGGVVAGFGHYH